MERDVYAKIVAKLKKIADDLQNLPDVSSLEEKIGDLTGLDTTVKTDLVSAINEVLGDIPDVSTLETSIGDLTDLDTTAKTDLVSAINEVLGYEGELTDLNTTAKTNLVSAINEVLGLNTKTTSGNFTKIGKIVFYNETLWTTVSGASVPAGYRPATSFTSICMQRTSAQAADAGPGKLTINTDGTIATDKAEFYGSASWFID